MYNNIDRGFGRMITFTNDRYKPSGWIVHSEADTKQEADSVARTIEKNIYDVEITEIGDKFQIRKKVKNGKTPA